jgi:tight adherence protein B
MSPVMTGTLAGALVMATAAACRLATRSTRTTAVVRRASSTLTRGDAHDGSFGTATQLARIPRLGAPSWLPAALVDAGYDARPDTVWTAWMGSVLAGAMVATILGGLGLAALTGVLLIVAPLTVLRVTRGRGPARLDAALPGGLESVARALRSGASLRQAVEEAAEVTSGALGHELSRVSADVGHGMPLVAALEQLAERRPLPGVRLAVAALCLGAETGGAQAQAVDGVATTIRERLAVAAEARALASQARMSALVIGLAPLGFGIFAASTDPRTAQFLLHTSAGLLLLAAGLALDGVGWLWMQRLCRVRP